MRLLFIAIIGLIAFQCTYAQTDNLQIGSGLNLRQANQGALYDYSDPEAINIKVNVWGFVKFPGKYIVPEKTTVNDLISYAGGPLENADLEKLRIYRPEKDSAHMITEFNYNDLLWEKQVKKITLPPQLNPGDYLLVPGFDRMYFREYLTLGLSIVSTLVSIAILIINVTK